MSTKFYYLILTLAFIGLALSACSDFDNRPKENQPAIVSIESLPDFVTTSVAPTPTPEKYIIYFSWPKIDDSKKLRIRLLKTLTIVSSEQQTFSIEVAHNQNLTFNFDVLDFSEKIEKSFSKLVQIPKDLVVRPNDPKILEDQKLVAKRIFISGNAPLITNGHNVILITEELISDHGVIETYLPETKSSLDLNGNSGGNLEIRSLMASGSLKVFMRGENGGESSQGPSHQTRAPSGEPPLDGTTECGTTKNLKDTFSNCTCSSFGRAGTNGKPGIKGLTGPQGTLGGDSGNLKIEIMDASGLFLETTTLPGSGGAGGPGGPGQLGGIALENFSKCAGKKGQDGPSGPQGDSGEKGIDGKKGLTCIHLTSENKNDCF